MTNPKTPYLLCILDGLGLNPNPEGNAVQMAKTPTLSKAFLEYSNTTLVTHGERVGLPAGQMGNSEVGHLNIGAGRVVEQWLLRISRALETDYVKESAPYQSFLKALTPQSRIHIAGLISDGGVHSHINHLKLLLKNVRRDSNAEIVLHCITDGRDTSPDSALPTVKDLEQFITSIGNCSIATVSGRFYAMDRDKRWERVEKAYNSIAYGKYDQGIAYPSASAAIQAAYTNKVTDEFIEPCVISSRPIQADDAFIFFNFREDRAREIVAALCSNTFDGFARTAPKFAKERVLCFTEYDHSFGFPFLFEALEIKNHIGEVLSNLGKTQLRVAETEKYPHVTYFFNGGIEKSYPGEERILIPSPRDVKTYDQKPEMSAYEVTNTVVQALRNKQHDFIVVNLANCDMVGHTGVLDAAIKAVETVDTCLGRMLDALKGAGGVGIIIADHGNAEQMIDYQTKQPFTQHTMFPVPCILADFRTKQSPLSETTLRTGGALCDLAPSFLTLMGEAIPKEMTGKSLIE